MDPVPGPAGTQIAFTVLLKGSETEGLPPDFAQALLGCGFREVITSGTSVAYQATSECDGAVTGNLATTQTRLPSTNRPLVVTA